MRTETEILNTLSTAEAPSFAFSANYIASLQPDELSETVLCHIAEHFDYALGHIPLDCITESAMIHAVSKEAYVLDRVPLEHRSNAVCKQAIAHHPASLYAIPKNTLSEAELIEYFQQCDTHSTQLAFKAIPSDWDLTINTVIAATMGEPKAGLRLPIPTFEQLQCVERMAQYNTLISTIRSVEEERYIDQHFLIRTLTQLLNSHILTPLNEGVQSGAALNPDTLDEYSRLVELIDGNADFLKLSVAIQQKVDQFTAAVVDAIADQHRQVTKSKSSKHLNSSSLSL